MNELQAMALHSATWSDTLMCSFAAPSLIDIEIINRTEEDGTLIDDAIFTLDTIQAAQLADWLNAWLKIKQEAATP